MCGNHVLADAAKNTGTGSPPRVREPHRSLELFSVVVRITPACAGTTSSQTVWHLSGGDHPRVCGNHQMWGKSFGYVPGSPPRVREPRLSRSLTSSPRRITPACAGTTWSRNRRRHRIQDHPRVCGNHWFSHRGHSTREGSPPRVREPQRM